MTIASASSAVRAVGGILLTALVLTSCASRGETEGGDGNDVILTVVNDRIPGTMLTIYAVPDGGVRRMLGTVAAGETATFEFSAAGGQYRFVARELGGRQLVSPPITVVPPELVDWRLQTNMVLPSRSSGW
jgi:hypothetical protein